MQSSNKSFLVQRKMFNKDLPKYKIIYESNSFCSKLKKNDVCSHTNLHTFLCKFFYSCPYMDGLFYRNIDISTFILLYLLIYQFMTFPFTTCTNCEKMTFPFTQKYLDFFQSLVPQGMSTRCATLKIP